MIQGKLDRRSYMRIILDEDDMHTFKRIFMICDFQNVCVTCPIPETSLPPSLGMVMDQFQESVRTLLQFATQECEITDRRVPQLPSMRIGFSLGNQYRHKKLDHLHDLMKFKYDNEKDSECSVESETLRISSGRYPVFDGTIHEIPFKFTRTYHWYASYYTVDDQQNYDPFFTDPIFDLDSDDDWQKVVR